MAHNEFGKRLKQVFGNASNKEIGAKIGVSAPAVQNYVSGRIPDGDKLKTIAEVTNCDLHWLLTGETKYPDTTQPDELYPTAVSELDHVYAMFSGFDEALASGRNIDEMKLELEVMALEIQLRLKQAELAKAQQKKNDESPAHQTGTNRGSW